MGEEDRREDYFDLSDITLFITAIWPGLSSLLAAAVVLGVLIFAHEFGHFLVAKLSGVGVLKFSLGFGRRLVGFRRGETEYVISAFPLGGYVKMIGGEGEETGERLTPDELRRSFMAQPVWKRIAIVFAGPAFNIFMAVLLCYVIFLTGFPTTIVRVDRVIPGSPGQAAGFVRGDVIEEMDGQPVDFWEEASPYIKSHPGRVIDFKVRRDGKTLSIKAAPALKDGRGYLGVMGSAVIAAVMSGSPADKAGMRANDRVIAVDGHETGSWDDMVGIVKASPGRRLDFAVERAGRRLDLMVTPTLSKASETGGKSYGIIGVEAGADTEKVAYGPVESIGLASQKALYMTGFTVDILARIIRGKEKASNLGGPITIVQMSGREARQGPTDLVFFMALLSVNLGVINLFPIPILDGGLIMFLAVEAVTGRPLSTRMREAAQQAGLFILVALMVFVFYNDIMRFFGLMPTWK